MPITYGLNLAKSWEGRARRLSDSVLMKAYTTHTETSDVFLSYKHSDRDTAFGLAEHLHRRGRRVFIDIHDDSLLPGEKDLDKALITAITNADTIVVIVSDATQGSWWVPWEIGVSTPFEKPRAMYKPMARFGLPAYLEKLLRLRSFEEADAWVLRNSGSR